VYSVQPAGLGELQIAFEKLKQRLAEEGLFDAAHKVPIPPYPESIGIVTSTSGAAIQDLLSVLTRRQPGIRIILRPAAVQGPGAARDIAGAIDEMNAFGDVDVLIVARGGGSLEDLWAFNEESVARAIYRSEIPVIAAIGHEIDFTIADFVADVRAPTPSAAAEIAVQERDALLDIIRHKWYTVHSSVVSQLDRQQKHVHHLLHSHALNRPVDFLHQMGQRIDEIERSIRVSITHRLAMHRAGTTSLEQRMQALNPLLVLRRGYAIISQGARLISSARSVRHPDNIEIRFHDGVVPATIMDTKA
jgi:exodeoxyribonuclease VII large subunit